MNCFFRFYMIFDFSGQKLILLLKTPKIHFFMKLQAKDIFYIIILLALFFWMRSDKDVITVNTTTTDTIYLDTTTPSVKYEYITKNPKPIKTYKKEYKLLLAQYSNSKDSLSIINSLLDSLTKANTVNVYEEVYEDSLYSAKITSIVKGELLESRFKHVLKPRKFQIKEIHTEEKKFPKYSLYYGFRSNSGRLPNTNPSLGGSFGFQSRKGTIYSIGYDTSFQWSVHIQKRFFTKY